MRKLTSPDTQIREKRSPGDYVAGYSFSYTNHYDASYSAGWHRSVRFDGINFDLSDVEVKTS